MNKIINGKELVPFGACASPRQMEWYRRGKTAFIHFTVNTFTGLEWGDGTESPDVFAPTELDCRQWCRVLRDGGFQAAIITAKHHDGFCLWPTSTTEHSIKNSPLAGRDVVREFVDACHEFGLKPGIYVSPWDRHCPVWGTESYNDYYATQLTELMTQYGPIWECWWDGAGSMEARYDWGRWANIVRTYQPQCVIFGSFGAAEQVDLRYVGNEIGSAGENCYATIDLHSILVENTGELSQGKADGTHFIPAEADVSIRPGWFWHEDQNQQVKTPDELVDYWFRSAGRNAGILLNLPPDRRGLISDEDALSVKLWKEKMDSIFGHDLAQQAHVHGENGAENLLSDDPEQLFVADEDTFDITFSFDKEITFDCFQIEEAVEYGHRVRGFRLEALTAEGWMLIKEGCCIGFCRAERFPAVTAREVRLKITKAAVPPILRRFRLFTGAAPKESASFVRSGQLKLQKVSYHENEMVIELGGIYPFNKVELLPAPKGEWRVWAFNGAKYEEAGQSDASVCRFPDQNGSYRLKIVAAEAIDENTAVRVFRE